MRQPLLSVCEIRQLDEVYCDAYTRMVEWRRREPLAAHIHLPWLPELLSVSIAAAVAPQLIGEALLIGIGRHDLATAAGEGVAVKGTGPSRWIRVTAVDRTAKWLVWVDYAGRVQARQRAVELLAIDVEKILRDAPGELTRSQLAKRARRLPAARYHPSSGRIQRSAARRAA